MDIVNFFEKVAGTWFSQRTTHFAPGQPSQTGQATLDIQAVDLQDAAVLTLCEQENVEAKNAIFAYSIQQAGQASTYGGSTAPSRRTLFVGFKSEETTTGLFLSQTEQEGVVAGTYQLEDEVLTLSVNNDAFQSEERLWYMNPNLRMRTNLVKRTDGSQMASFCSEIRRAST